MQHNPNRAAHQYIGHVIDSRHKHYDRDNESEALIHQHGRVISVVTQISVEKNKEGFKHRVSSSSLKKQKTVQCTQNHQPGRLFSNSKKH